MTWLILLFFAAFGVAYLLRRRRGKAELEAALEYRFSFEADEVFRGEYLTLCQTVINRSARPIPFLKLETLMPDVRLLCDQSGVYRIECSAEYTYMSCFLCQHGLFPLWKLDLLMFLRFLVQNNLSTDHLNYL